MSPKKIVAIVAIVVVTILLTIIGMGGLLIQHLRSQSQQGGHVEGPLTMELVNYFPAPTVNGTQWVVEITNGSKDPASVRLQIFDPNTGAMTLDKTVLGFSDLDGQYQDGPEIGKLEKGDRIWISGQGGHVQHGSKVQLVVGTSIVAGPLTLP